MPPSRFVIKVNNNLIKGSKNHRNYKTKHRDAAQKNRKSSEQNQPLNAAGKEQSRGNRPAKSRQQLAEKQKAESAARRRGGSIALYVSVGRQQPTVESAAHAQSPDVCGFQCCQSKAPRRFLFISV